jgi:hypothetical protein
MADLTKRDLVGLAEAKLRDAKLLFAAASFSNAYYLAGYAAELLLKAVIVRQFRADTLPDRRLVNNVHSHDLEKLKNLAGLGDALSQANNPALIGLWQVAAAWTEEARYGEWSEAEARQLIEALEDPGNGVLQWLQQHL